MSPHEHAIEDLVKIGAAAAALGVSVDTLRRWERAGKVTFERRDNRRYISADLANLLRERGAAGLTSARNRLQGIVIAVKRDEVMAQIDLACWAVSNRLADVARGGGRTRLNWAPRPPRSSRRRR